jgi:hypothetical protein
MLIAGGPHQLQRIPGSISWVGPGGLSAVSLLHPKAGPYTVTTNGVAGTPYVAAIYQVRPSGLTGCIHRGKVARDGFGSINCKQTRVATHLAK